jgi:C4-type Zn-finger protein
MPEQVICVGYKCPACGHLVTVSRSCDPVPRLGYLLYSECSCEYFRAISIEELQSLEVWRESAA